MGSHPTHPPAYAPVQVEPTWLPRGDFYCYVLLLLFIDLKDGPVDLVGGGGGRVEEFVKKKKKKTAEPQKGIKKICTCNIVKKKLQSKTSKLCDRTTYTV